MRPYFSFRVLRAVARARRVARECARRLAPVASGCAAAAYGAWWLLATGIGAVVAGVLFFASITLAALAWVVSGE